MNVNVNDIMDRLKARGFSVRLVDGAVKVAGPEKPDAETWGLLNELRERKAEVLSVLSENDPVLPVDAWYPVFRELHHRVIDESKDFDYGWVKQNRPESFREMKTIEDRIDRMGAARLSEIVATMREWRDMVLRAYFEQRKAERESALRRDC